MARPRAQQRQKTRPRSTKQTQATQANARGCKPTSTNPKTKPKSKLRLPTVSWHRNLWRRRPPARKIANPTAQQAGWPRWAGGTAGFLAPHLPRQLFKGPNLQTCPAPTKPPPQRRWRRPPHCGANPPPHQSGTAAGGAGGAALDAFCGLRHQAAPPAAGAAVPPQAAAWRQGLR
ncbi:hypothetical protein Rsub_11215 [Raphidocelis subcapitata]|uniref:Uncharacterized protein n=1 Tax=Raphidocelis subcapitata TaxID=307507 RepID=A0A2V0PLG2_9CHLO|nr:hypothetical protein Rsub_11215 [Raphidocelis subcapitata]|eukprot:GBF97865.1 hypothetical protein Rsub_11215 [Raphidocelis subcapitata]